MKLTKEEITEFQNLFKERYGFEITRDDAIDNLIDALYLSSESQKVGEMSKEKRKKLVGTLERESLRSLYI